VLPDFPTTKKEIKRAVTERLRRGVYQEATLLSRIRKFQSHEGDSFTIHRLNGTIETSRYRETAVEFAIGKDELATLTPEALMQKIDKAASEMAAKTSQTIYDRLDEGAAASGQVLDAKGGPLSPDTLLKALEMIDMDFDQKGEPTGLTIVVGPELWERFRQRAPEWDADPGFKRRHRELIQRKREAWLDRESRRKLAD
jgi:hypothetical protein